MQYVLIRPGKSLSLGLIYTYPMYIEAAITIAGIICQHYNVLCDSGSFSVHYAELYLESVDFVSIR